MFVTLTVNRQHFWKHATSLTENLNYKMFISVQESIWNIAELLNLTLLIVALWLVFLVSFLFITESVIHYFAEFIWKIRIARYLYYCSIYHTVYEFDPAWKEIVFYTYISKSSDIKLCKWYNVVLDTLLKISE